MHERQPKDAADQARQRTYDWGQTREHQQAAAALHVIGLRVMLMIHGFAESGEDRTPPSGIDDRLRRVNDLRWARSSVGTTTAWGIASGWPSRSFGVIILHTTLSRFRHPEAAAPNSAFYAPLDALWRGPRRAAAYGGGAHRHRLQ
jgi:hypothetical protein